MSPSPADPHLTEPAAALGLQWLLNPRRGLPGLTVLPAGGFRRARAEITAWPGYAPTPLRDLPALAMQAGVASVQVKDESGRFGLGSFKALGGAYAVLGVMQAELARQGIANAATTADLMAGAHAGAGITVTCATDGNHARSVAWGAQRFGANCVIFVHPGVSQGRRDAIAAYGAEVREAPGTYDDSVRAAAAAAAEHGWHVVSDTSWPGYTEIPREVMQGYRLMAAEVLESWSGPPPTHAFVQAGVGGMAAAVSVQLRTLQPAPALVVVEPHDAACLMASAKAETITAAGSLDTLMAGLACGEPSLIAWQELERAAAAFLSIPDDAAVNAMRVLAGCGVVSGESGAAGLAGLLRAAADPQARAALGLDRSSRILLFSTEGATDPELYARLMPGTLL
ncbi:MAG: diaminopropionate ammonia-lyase [Janthinobacterium lividum]